MIGGWLLFYITLSIIQIALYFFVLGGMIVWAPPGFFTKIPMLWYISSGIQAVAMVWLACTVIQLCTKKHDAAASTRFFLKAQIATLVCFLFVLALINPAKLFQHAKITMDQTFILSYIIYLIPSICWLQYFIHSKRVKGIWPDKPPSFTTKTTNYPTTPPASSAPIATLSLQEDAQSSHEPTASALKGKIVSQKAILLKLASIMGYSKSTDGELVKEGVSYGVNIPNEVMKEALFLNTFLDKPKEGRDKEVMQEILGVAKCDIAEASLFGAAVVESLNKGELPFVFVDQDATSEQARPVNPPQLVSYSQRQENSPDNGKDAYPSYRPKSSPTMEREISEVVAIILAILIIAGGVMLSVCNYQTETDNALPQSTQQRSSHMAPASASAVDQPSGDNQDASSFTAPQQFRDWYVAVTQYPELTVITGLTRSSLGDTLAVALSKETHGKKF